MSLQSVVLGDIAIPDRVVVSPESSEAAVRPYLGLEQIAADTGHILSYATNSVEGKSTTFAFDDSHVLYGKLRPYLNKVAVPDRVGRCSTEIIPLKPQGVDREYLAFLLRSELVVNAAMADKTGSRMPRADMEALLGIEVAIHDSAAEQRIIAARLKVQLAEVEAARRAAQVQSKELDTLIAAVYRETFRNIVPVAEPKSLGTAPSGWGWRKLTDIARLESGHTPSRSRPDWWGGNISWVSLTEIRALDGQWVERTQIRTNEAGIANSSARLLPRGTVCFSRTASVGFVTILAVPMATSQDFANWVSGEDLDPEYLMHALIRSRTELRSIATGATHKTIYMPALNSFQLCAPPRSEQARIVSELKEKLKNFTQIRNALKHQQDELTLLPQKILSRVFEN